MIDEKLAELSPEMIKVIEQKTTLEWFDGLPAFVERLDAIKASGKNDKDLRDGGDGWAGDSYSETRSRIYSGNPEAAAKAEKVLSELETAGLITPDTVPWELSVVGFFPSIPAFMAGSPEAMFNKTPRTSDRGEIRVFVDVGVNASTSHAQLVSRGTAIFGLIMALSMKRPTDLYLFLSGASGNNGMASAVVRFETRPLDVASLSYVLTSPSYLRRMHFAVARQYGFWGAYAYGLYPGDAQRIPAVRKGLGLRSTDILIAATGAADSDGLGKEPVKWVQNQLEINRAIIEAGDSE